MTSGPASSGGIAPQEGVFPSPNHSDRRGGLTPRLIVLHYTAMDSCAAARARLCDPTAEVSAHWLIGMDGRAEALVPEARRAWHAGAGSWGGLDDINSRSIGIELDNRGAHPFPEAQMTTLEDLLRGIMTRWEIGAEGVIGHSDMAPDRKCDPGPRFDWARLVRAGLAVGPSPAVTLAPEISPEITPSPERFVALARIFGYGDHPAEVLLNAMRQRFRPRHDGPLDAVDMAIMADLAARFGTDGASWKSS